MKTLVEQDKILEIRRSGDFVVGSKVHRAQCGMHGEKVLTYNVLIRGREIDCPRGWLLDNNDIPNYFEHTYANIREFRSCEAIASQAIDDFKALCMNYKARPHYIRVAVSGIPNSEIACVWQKRRHEV